ncbi:MAG: hypothetical protein Q8Q09_28990 [Deltaproteobacteria bacterium]|nr:hypothetical protein [Deltaproteobacteria bacterium]
MNERPLVVAIACTDLLQRAKIRAAVERHGARSLALGAGTLTVPLGVDGMVADLQDPRIDVPSLLANFTSEFPMISVLCFAPHVDAELLALGRARATVTVTRSKLERALGVWLAALGPREPQSIA